MRRPADPHPQPPRPGPPARALMALLLVVGALHLALLGRWTDGRPERFGAPAPTMPVMQVRRLVMPPEPASAAPAQVAVARAAPAPAPVQVAPAAAPAAPAAETSPAAVAPASPASRAWPASPTSPTSPASPASPASPTGLASPAWPTAPASTGTPPAAEADSDESPIAAGDIAPPVYATHLPGDATLRYRLQRGPLTGEAWLVWRATGDRYTLHFEARGGPGRPLIEQHSHGLLDAGGLAPERFADRRRGRGPQAAQFDRAGGEVSFSGPSHRYPAWPGAQDRLGWIVQLAAIQAAAVQQPPGEPLPEVTLFVVGARGGAGWWTFRRMGREAVALPSGASVDAWHFERRPAVPRDLHVEAWLDPARGFWPVRLRWRPALGGPPLELLSADPDTAAGR